MKRVFVGMLILIMSLCMGACGEKTKDTTGDSPEMSEADEMGNTSSQEEDTEQEEYTPDPDLPGIAIMYYDDGPYGEGGAYCADAPVLHVNYGRGQGVANMEDYFVIYDIYMETASSLLYNVDLTKIKEASDVLDEMREQICSACDDYMPHAEDCVYTITKEENVKVNQWDMCRFEGEFELLYDMPDPAVDYTKAKFVGYSVIKDGCPAYFIVVDVPTEGGEDDIGTMADKIAKTFRDYSE